MKTLAIDYRHIRNVVNKSKLPTKVMVEVSMKVLTPSEKKRLSTALRNGVLFSMTGRVAEMYEFVGKAYNIPWALVRKERTKSYRANDLRWVLEFGTGEGANNTPLSDLLKAEQMAERMADSEYYQSHWAKDPAEFDHGWHALTHLKGDELIREATKARIAHAHETIEAAITDIELGNTILLIEKEIGK